MMKRFANPKDVAFFLLIGLSIGLLANQFAPPDRALASGVDRYQDYIMVTGGSYDQEIDVVWMLDYDAARLLCVLVSRQGSQHRIFSLDLEEELKEAKDKPHFLMTTGHFDPEQIDLLYLAETTSSTMLVIAPPNFQRGRGTAAAPTIIQRIPFRG